MEKIRVLHGLPVCYVLQFRLSHPADTFTDAQ